MENFCERKFFDHTCGTQGGIEFVVAIDDEDPGQAFIPGYFVVAASTLFVRG